MNCPHCDGKIRDAFPSPSAALQAGKRTRSTASTGGVTIWLKAANGYHQLRVAPSRIGVDRLTSRSRRRTFSSPKYVVGGSL